MRKKLLLLFFSASLWLHAFDIETFDRTNAFTLGNELMNFSFGMHKIDSDGLNTASAVVGIHGSNSEGYEWVYPLWKLNEETNSVYFYRWDDQQCANQQNKIFLQAVEEAISYNPSLNKITILAHSYGGLLLLHSLEDLNVLVNKMGRSIEIEVHLIAALLSPPKALEVSCSIKSPPQLFKNLKIFNWKTIKEIDGAFRSYQYDPQDIRITNSKQTRLPENYNGKKLGHNWSISWVADQLKPE